MPNENIIEWVSFLDNVYIPNSGITIRMGSPYAKQSEIRVDRLHFSRHLAGVDEYPLFITDISHLTQNGGEDPRQTSQGKQQPTYFLGDNNITDCICLNDREIARKAKIILQDHPALNRERYALALSDTLQTSTLDVISRRTHPRTGRYLACGRIDSALHKMIGLYLATAYTKLYLSLQPDSLVQPV